MAGTRYEAAPVCAARSRAGPHACDPRVARRRAVGSVESCRAATSAWDRFAALPYTALGGDSIELYAYQLSAVTGDSFDLDGVTLTAGP